MTDPVPAPETPAPKTPWLTGGRAGYLALGLSVVALGLAAAPWFTGGNVRTYLLSHPEVLQEASQALQDKEAQARVDVINDLAQANAGLLKPDPRDPAFGPADAKVTVVEFFDFRCPGCKAVAHDYRALMAAHPEVRFVFKDWPILDRGDDVTSQYAARAALAAHQQGKYLAVYDALMTEPALTPETIDRILAENGVDLARAAAVIRAPQTDDLLSDVQVAGATLGLVGTPTFLINGRTTSTINPVEVSAAIEAAKRSQVPSPAR